MAVNKKIVIRQLIDLMRYFPSHIDKLNYYVNILNNNEYTVQIDNEIKNFIFNDLFNNVIRYDQFDYGLNELHKLYTAIKNSIILYNKVYYDNNNDKYKILPYKLDNENPDYKETCRYTTMKLIDDYFSGTSLIDATNKQAQPFINQVNDYNSALINNEVYPYYGDIPFLTERMCYIINCLENISNSDRINPRLRDEFKTAYNNANNIFNYMNSRLYKSIPKYDEYVIIEDAYIKMLQIEDSYSKLLEPIWKEYLTDPSNYQQGDEYHFLVHSVTRSHVDENKLTKVCTTLATDKCNPETYPCDIGYIMDFDISQVSTMSNDDAGSWISTKEEFVERGCPDGWQLAEQISDNQYVWYELSEISKLLLPWDIEEKMIRNNQINEAAGRPQNAFSEIFLHKTNKPLKVLGYFAETDKGLEMLSEINKDNNKPVIDFRNIHSKTK